MIRPENGNATGVQVSVVVPTYKRPELLCRCLEALLVQDFDPARFEIIVVDDARDPETRRLVSLFDSATQAPRLSIRRDPFLQPVHGKAFESAHISVKETERVGRSISLRTESTESLVGSPAVKYLTAPSRGGPAAARNLGWRAASGEIIAFTDDDCIPRPDWLKNGMKAFMDGVAGTSGRVLVPLPLNPTDFEKEMAGLESSRFVTANCFYRRSALDSVGGFDENFTMPWREDSDLFFRLLESGFRLADAPQAVIVHPPRPAPWGVSLKLQRKTMDNALIYKKHPRLYRQYLQASPPWEYYAIVAALCLLFTAAALRLPWLAWPAACLWAALTLRFCLRRLRDTSHRWEHLAEMALTSILIPPLAVFWRLWGAIKYRVIFL